MRLGYLMRLGRFANDGGARWGRYTLRLLLVVPDGHQTVADPPPFRIEGVPPAPGELLLCLSVDAGGEVPGPLTTIGTSRGVSGRLEPVRVERHGQGPFAPRVEQHPWNENRLVNLRDENAFFPEYAPVVAFSENALAIKRLGDEVRKGLNNLDGHLKGKEQDLVDLLERLDEEGGSRRFGDEDYFRTLLKDIMGPSSNPG